MNRRRRLVLGAATAAMLTPTVRVAHAASMPIEVWKDASWGCCKEGVKHLQANGFAVKVNDTGNAAARARLGIPARLGSCHTAAMRGYAIEGHVSAADIKRLLDEKPSAIGLAVPGMPIGSPGMEVGDRRDPYDVLLVLENGGTRVFRASR